MQSTINLCRTCLAPLPEPQYSNKSKYCATCAYNRVKGRGLSRYYKKKGTVRVSITITNEHKNFLEKNFTDLRLFVNAKLDEEIQKRRTETK